MNWIKANPSEIGRLVADRIAKTIEEKNDATLILPTGSSPIPTYEELCARHARGEVDFSNVTTFNLDEYYPISPDNAQSYHRFMEENLFSHVNLDRAKIHVPDGQAKDPEKSCRDYEAELSRYDVDLALIGVGRNGHIGFNEPDTALTAGTHVVCLTQDTRDANARFFDRIEDVPTHAMTMGIASILRARSIILIAAGESKRAALEALRGDTISTDCPVTLLKLHRDLTVYTDLSFDD